ncbi:MAG: hypothetical protein LBK13_09285 [Spirochaetales bacterium]|jgi:hypothetical protein|nr:hypothetical protein [Spirochaetales bacterium]
MPVKDPVLSDFYRLKTLDTLLAAGVYVNDYPGFVLERKDISYFFIKFPVPAGERKPSKKRLDEFLAVVSAHNEKNKLVGTEREVKVFYLDDFGNGVFGRVEDAIKTLVFTSGAAEMPAERIFQVNLNRIFSADGIDGPYEIRNSEVKDVYEGLQKFIAVYTHGWLGLFRQYELVRDRTLVFRQFKPFKFPLFGSRERLKNTVFRIQFGVRTPYGDEGFKQISTKYGDYSLQDAVAVK